MKRRFTIGSRRSLAHVLPRLGWRGEAIDWKRRLNEGEQATESNVPVHRELNHLVHGFVGEPPRGCLKLRPIHSADRDLVDRGLRPEGTEAVKGSGTTGRLSTISCVLVLLLFGALWRRRRVPQPVPALAEPVSFGGDVESFLCSLEGSVGEALSTS